MKLLKWTFIGIGSVMVLVVFILVGAQIYINTDGMQQWIQSDINAKIPGTITWRKSRISLLDGRAEWDDVMLNGPKNHRLIELSRIRLRVSWMGLLRGELAIKDLYIETPKIYLASDRSGNLNLVQAIYDAGNHQSGTGERKGFPLNILLRKLEMVNSVFIYRAVGEGSDADADHVVFRQVNLTIKDGNFQKQKGRIDCRITDGEVRIGGIPSTIDQLSLMADIQQNRVTSLVVNLKTRGHSTHVFGNIERLFTDDPLLNLTIESRVSLSETKDFVSIGSGYTGTVQMNSTIRGPLNNPKVESALDYNGGKLAGKQIDRIQVKCLLKDRHLSGIDANVYTPIGIFDLKGDVDFKEAFPDGWFRSHPELNEITYRLTMVQRNTLLNHLPIKTPGLRGTIHGRMKIQGTGIHPKTLKAETDLQLFVDKLSPAGVLSAVDVQINARSDMEKGRVTVHQLEIKSGKNEIKLNGSYNLSTLGIDADFGLTVPTLADMAPLLGIKGARGAIEMHGNANGTSNTIVMVARLKGEALGINNIKVGNASADIRVSEGKIFLKAGKVLNGASKLDIEGSVRVFDPAERRLLKPSSVDLSVKGDALFMEDFIQGMKGKFALNGQIKGDIPRLQGGLNLRGEKLDFLMQKIDEVQLISTFDGDRIYFDPLNIRLAPNENILMNGWISMEKDYDLNFASKGISIKNIAKLKAKAIDSGKVSFSLSGKGGIKNPGLKGTVSLGDIRIKEKSLEDIQLRVEVKDQKAHISGGLNFVIDTWYHLSTKDFSALVRFNNAVLTPYLKLAGGTELSGSVTGKIEIKGNVEELDRINGAVDISQLALYWKQTELVQARDLSLFLNHDGLSIPGMRFSLLRNGHVEMDGIGKLNGDLDIKAGGNIPLEVVPMLTNWITDAAGEVDFSLKIKGNRSKPAIFMDVDLKGGSMILPGQFQKIHDMNGRIHMTSTGVVLDNIQGMLGAGSFNLMGTADLDGYQASNMKITLVVDDIPVMIPDTLETRLSSTLKVSGTSKKSLISGDIQLLEGTYFKDVSFNLMETLGKPSRKGAPITSKSRWPGFNTMLLDVKIRHREPFMVDNNVAVLSIKPDLKVYGSMNRPLVSGRAEIESGAVYFRKKEFEVKKGIFDFINPYKIEPTINIQSEVDIRKWNIFLNISGTPDTLKIDMTSDPALNEKDIVSLLIAGKTTQELIEEEGGISTSPAQILANVLSEKLKKEVQEATGLDVVELEYQEANNNEETNDVKVTVGKALSRRVNVSYGVQTKNAKVVQQVIAEYKFLENLLMKTFQDTEGNFGGEFQFRLEFR